MQFLQQRGTVQRPELRNSEFEGISAMIHFRDEFGVWKIHVDIYVLDWRTETSNRETTEYLNIERNIPIKIEHVAFSLAQCSYGKNQTLDSDQLGPNLITGGGKLLVNTLMKSTQMVMKLTLNLIQPKKFSKAEALQLLKIYQQESVISEKQCPHHILLAQHEPYML